MSEKKYWLVKSEPEAYSIDQFMKDKETWWEGVRNYQARNLMKDMKPGDEVIFYHSSCTPPGIVGLAKVAEEAAPDKTALNKKSIYFDEKATAENPIWFCAKIKFVKKFSQILALDDLKKNAALKNMVLLKKGSRLSVQPVSAKEYESILKMV